MTRNILDPRHGTQLVLGIESSCDETAAALVTNDRRILAHRLAGQEAAHAPFGGVVPEIAARAHVDALMPLVEAALTDAGVALADVDAIAATAGPGLIGGVMVGLVTAKGLAHAANKPLIAVNHLEGHALSPRLSDPDLDFPYLLLLVSGGHCQLLAVEGVGHYRRLATTIDDAAGEAFDKTAKLLGLGFPGGPAVERAAMTGDAKAVPLPRPLMGSPEPHFSFAGLKSAVLRARDSGLYRAEDIAASFQAAVVDCLIDRTRRAIVAMPGATALVVAGGVAANTAVRTALQTLAAANGMRFVAAAAVAVHRQCRDDRMGGCRAIRARLDRSARRGRTTALAARSRGRDRTRRRREGMRIGVIGGGAWGTALAQLAAADGEPVLIWAHEADVVSAINLTHQNRNSCPASRCRRRSRPPATWARSTPAMRCSSSHRRSMWVMSS